MRELAAVEALKLEKAEKEVSSFPESKTTAHLTWLAA
jgi:hypothetical protein